VWLNYVSLLYTCSEVARCPICSLGFVKTTNLKGKDWALKRLFAAFDEERIFALPTYKGKRNMPCCICLLIPAIISLCCAGSLFESFENVVREMSLTWQNVWAC